MSLRSRKLTIVVGLVLLGAAAGSVVASGIFGFSALVALIVAPYLARRAR